MGFLNKTFLFFNYFLAAALLVSFLSAFIDPVSFWPVSFFGLAYPFLVAGNIVFMLFWLLRVKLHFLISLLSIAVGWDTLKATFPVHPSFIQTAITGTQRNSLHDDTAGDPLSGGIRVMSFNVRLFDLYNWKDKANLKTRDRIFDLLRMYNPDVLCLQEFYQDDSREFITLDTLVKFLNASNVHVKYTVSLRRIHHWGIATFSVFPIVNKGEILFNKGNNLSIYTDIRVGADTMRIYNMHLASVHFSKKDYLMLKDITELSDGLGAKQDLADTLSSGFSRIMAKIKKGFIRRAGQVTTVAAHIGTSPYPVIVFGDINDTPASFAYHELRNGLMDAFTSNGFGLGATYTEFWPFFRIDYILHSPSLTSADFEIAPEILSDHKAIVCRISRAK